MNKTYILVGTFACAYFLTNDWDALSNSINRVDGDIIAWDKETESVATLLDMLSGWYDFQELTEEDIQDIKNNTNIEIV